MNDAANELMFSTASLWEIAIKRGLGGEDFQVDPRLFRRGWLDNGYVNCRSALSTPSRWRDCLLLTAGPSMAKYLGPVRRL
jgi:hypothetical protein